MMSGKWTFDLYGDMTIAEAVEALEAHCQVKVVRADLVGNMVTLTYEAIPQPDDCPDCGYPIDCCACWDDEEDTYDDSYDDDFYHP